MHASYVGRDYNEPMVEHYIQKDILLRLSKAANLRFSELKPEGMESNIFMYHLRQLMAQKLVEKTEDGYRLADEGLAYIDGFSFHTLRPRKQPKVISILAVRNQQREWLVAQRKYQPYIHQFMLPSGKQHLGESPKAHAMREVKEKLHMIVADLKRRGLADIRIYRGDKLITHVLAHIYEGQTQNDVLPPESHQFVYSWTSRTSKDHVFLAGTLEIIEKLENEKDLFFLSLDTKDV